MWRNAEKGVQYVTHPLSRTVQYADSRKVTSLRVTPSHPTKNNKKGRSSVGS